MSRQIIQNWASQTPSLNKKAYSFQDPLFASFGNKLVENIRTKKQNEIKVNSIDQSMDLKNQQKLIDEAMNISNRFQLLTQMMKISKYLLDPSMLFVSTQNKIKTQTLIECKSKQENQESKIICQNALKYLSFIETLNQEEHQFRKNQKTLTIDQNQEKKTSESRIYNESRQIIQKSKHKKNTSVRFTGQSSDTHKTNQRSINSKKVLEKDANNSLSGHEHSKFQTYRSSDNKTNSISETVEKMFQKIKTPRVINNEEAPLSELISFHSQRNEIDQFRQQMPFRQTQILEEKQMMQMNNGAQNKHKQKIKNTAIQQRGFSEVSTSLSMQKKITDKQKQLKIQQIKRNNKNIKIGKDIVNQNKEKSLATKTVNKTTQFQKMLKMASSGVKPI